MSQRQDSYKLYIYKLLIYFDIINVYRAFRCWYIINYLACMFKIFFLSICVKIVKYRADMCKSIFFYQDVSIMLIIRQTYIKYIL